MPVVAAILTSVPSSMTAMASMPTTEVAHVDVAVGSLWWPTFDKSVRVGIDRVAAYLTAKERRDGSANDQHKRSDSKHRA